ncbi:hypothetical protein HII31_03059 [Pseudocercospora fuligena]|uniref:B3/B4 tRNA-binding domain-containing protein n=1 Tax=Pseudocercospora fuligena TaxID=685502 RepID=A0A8H6RP89_9PEZI|nr:hypothetical protein HII31_03059 [Pseudocercospora fuligena]
MDSSPDLQKYLDAAYVAQEVFVLRPDYRALLVAVAGVTPQPSDEFSEGLLQDAELSARALLAKVPVNELPHIAAWREAYKAFGAKPNKTRNSLEALTRRTEAGLPRVNWLTDIYNATSVKHQIPFGGEDLDKYSSAPFLLRASGGENFKTTASGAKVIEHPNVGEVVWCDSQGITCRHWNWRQSPRTGLSERTSRVLFILDALEPISDDDLNAAADALVSALQQSSKDLQVARRLIGNE